MKTVTVLLSLAVSIGFISFASAAHENSFEHVDFPLYTWSNGTIQDRLFAYDIGTIPPAYGETEVEPCHAHSTSLIIVVTSKGDSKNKVIKAGDLKVEKIMDKLETKCVYHHDVFFPEKYGKEFIAYSDGTWEHRDIIKIFGSVDMLTEQAKLVEGDGELYVDDTNNIILLAASIAVGICCGSSLVVYFNSRSNLNNVTLNLSVLSCPLFTAVCYGIGYLIFTPTIL